MNIWIGQQLLNYLNWKDKYHGLFRVCLYLFSGMCRKKRFSGRAIHNRKLLVDWKNDLNQILSVACWIFGVDENNYPFFEGIIILGW